MISYHELTVNQPLDSGFRSQQIFGICFVMFAAFLHSFAMAGGFHPVKTSTTSFDGGEFCYKYIIRDYATSMSLAESIAEDLTIKKGHLAKSNDHVDSLYTLYLDASMGALSADRLRFAVGHLAQTLDAKKINQDLFMKKNKDIVPLSQSDLDDLAVQEIWPRLPYQITQLPKAKQALVTYFPFTNGFVSALMFTYKIMPSILKQAVDAGMKEPLVVFSTCSARQRMCTHTALSGKPFLLGQPDTMTYTKTVDPYSLIPWTDVRKTLLKPLAWMGLVASCQADEL